MQSWWAGAAERDGPKYLAIVAALEEAIRSGLLRAGERLPPQRELAISLGVDLTTVTRAYGLATDSGLIQGAGRLGSFVRNNVDLPAADVEAEGGMIMPPQPASALLPDALRIGMTKLLRAAGQSPLLQYQPSAGSVRDRREAAAAFTDRGIPTQEDDVIVTAGGQSALHAILATSLSTGDAIAAGQHVYPGLLHLAARLGLSLIPLSADDEGIDPTAIAAAARAGAQTLYVVPTNDNPTTATMTARRRHEVIDMARRHGLTIIEDDAYGLLPSRPPAPLAALAPDMCWHIASVSKIISPALRVAHVRAPSGISAVQLAADIYETAIMAPPLNAALVTSWLRDGSFATLVDAVRAEGVARQRLAAQHLTALSYGAHPEGYHLWVDLPDDIDAAKVIAATRPLGLSIVDGASFAINRARTSAKLRLSLGGSIDHPRLARALDRVVEVATRKG
ncbi:PLP-dependent aminotransferase family protein [Sphingomonas montanisoli]|uniref:PLP-dependent aminotransferase family protein n=1 Tax=Sphingomonas montanisoli TaxID=2606412 RepID=A0A5D9CF47_9SPHN|nr:PLP-dependent aminotransferase family protein [Sphingomonas montanisoli]TZG28725.1 PLP-dependent aminotransferase family protein [Sphingomonas montanisoli]